MKVCREEQVLKEFAGKLKDGISMEMVTIRDCTGEESVLRRRADKALKCRNLLICKER